MDIYKDDTVYYCKRVSVGWEVKAIPNVIGKIPVILFEQELEHEGTQPMIHRVESMESTDADVNDRFANPAMVATAEVLNSLPKAEEEAKLFILSKSMLGVKDFERICLSSRSYSFALLCEA